MRQFIGVVSTLLLVGSCLAAPQGATGDLNGLINDVFKKPAQDKPRQLPGQVVPVEATTTNFDVLIGDIFGTPSANNDNNPSTTTSEPDNCECVPYYQCQNGKISDNGIGLIDIRFKGSCDNYLDVCCAPPNIRPEEGRITPKPVVRKGCGQRNPEGVGFRITGAKDNEAQFGEFPWMVAILKEEAVGSNAEKLNVYQCGGALIHPRVVLTAGHCINGKQPSILKIRAGEWDTQTKNEIFPHQDRQVQAVIVHEKFHSGALYNDYGLLILTEPVDIIDNVDIVCLPETNMNFDYSRCFASGWGKDVFGKEGHYQVILKRVEMPMVPHDQCQSSLRTTRLGKYFTLDKTFVCAGGEPGKDTCKGDGGSPLVCPVPNDPQRFMQAGIVAWGIGCGENIPGVYANVAAAREWIDQQLQAFNIDSSEYTYSPTKQI